ncbi:MAG: hypothetical protein GXO35_06080, partial [Gammaproteobacteria bacterium]|nr:hypothetical protein [Gammaproteobacteria bacterium]
PAPNYRPVQQPVQSGFGGMMPWNAMQNMGGNMGQATPQPVYAPPPQPAQPFGNMMPWNAMQNMGQVSPQSTYAAPSAQPFGGMMPWNAMSGMGQNMGQPARGSQGFMMPGMEQGIRSMMQPGKIMAEEATPGMYMKPTWR